eukprot:3194492-Alexandrium_andersonii.AAC.1
MLHAVTACYFSFAPDAAKVQAQRLESSTGVPPDTRVSAGPLDGLCARRTACGSSERSRQATLRELQLTPELL